MLRDINRSGESLKRGARDNIGMCKGIKKRKEREGNQGCIAVRQ